MSVCVSSTLSSSSSSSYGIFSAVSMMHSFQTHSILPPSVDLSINSSSNGNQSLQNSSIDNEPNSEILLALIARNKKLEGELRKKYYISVGEI
jgi:hypothetical protein